jgi:hypothetical protein
VGPVGSVVYRFEISNNPLFSPVLVSATVAQGATFTMFTPESHLPSGVTLFWHVEAIDTRSGATSPYSTSWSFVTAPMVIQPPQLVSPAGHSIQQTLRPTFTVSNSATAGQPGRLVYRFEIATDEAFSAVVMSATPIRQLLAFLPARRLRR